MRSRWNLPIYVVYLGICMVVLGIIVGQIGFKSPWSHPFELTAVFKSGDGILTGNEVFMNGTKVGRVEDVQAVGGEAHVQMRIEDQQALPLHLDATAEVRKKNLLGETYIELSRGTKDAGDMQSGGDIPVEHTLTPVEIDQVLAVLDPQTRDRLTLLINGAGDATANRGGDMNAQAQSLNSLATSLNGPAAELAARQQQLEDIVLELQRFYDTLARQRDQVREEFGTWNQVMAELAAQDVQIGGTVQQADTLLQNLDTLASGEVGNLRSTLDQLPTALTSTNSFLTQSDTILLGIAPWKYLRSIHDVFPDLQTSFADTDPSTLDPSSNNGHQHFWSVYSVSCSSGYKSGQSSPPVLPNCDGASKASTGSQAPNASWAAVMGSAG